MEPRCWHFCFPKLIVRVNSFCSLFWCCCHYSSILHLLRPTKSSLLVGQLCHTALAHLPHALSSFSEDHLLCMLNRKGQCKWTCRLMPFHISFILLYDLVISINNSSLIWLKLPCHVLHTSLILVYLVAKFTHKRRDYYSNGGVYCFHFKHLDLPCWSVIH